MNIDGKFFKTGTWRYYYPNDVKADLQLKKEENYDFNGHKHGIFTSYDAKGNISRTEIYENGNKLKKK